MTAQNHGKRGDTTPKTIKGKLVGQDDFKIAIVEAVQLQGQASMNSLISTIGMEWDTKEKRKILGQTLFNMAKRGTLRRVEGERGLFEVSPGYHRRGVSVFHANEEGVLDVLRSLGGFARFSEIMDAYGLRARGKDVNAIRARRQRARDDRETDADLRDLHTDVSPNDTSEYQAILRVLVNSKKVRQDYLLRGWYNLPIDEIRNLPLRGRFAGLVIKATQLDFGVKRGWMDERDEFFTRVGSVVQAARRARGDGFRDLRDFVRIPKVAAALLDLSRRPRIARELSSWYSAETAAHIEEMKAQGASPEDVGAYRRQREDDELGEQYLVDLMKRFEAGGEGMYGVNTHLNAPLSFYTAIAEALSICPVAMSRGLLEVPSLSDDWIM
ncbi:hypothetical protein KIKIMORA_00010 [Brevundimonas phage vB_BpoS-Kikimora]|uniref:Uncharacterized protein n=1 Tax=Brevundimonas phage vB_BpoS-Kikimora TaxID=2948601 RepID=A0A9E7MRP3_9CAUD|nr:hypothetical protein KIKIMORA_00010 [Brevundimonas phage vB_BpoS-Kikimora]